MLYRFRLAHQAELGGAEEMMEMAKGSLSKGTVFSMVSLLKLVLAKEEYELFSAELERLMNELEKLVLERAFGVVMRETGFRDG